MNSRRTQSRSGHLGGLKMRNVVQQKQEYQKSRITREDVESSDITGTAEGEWGSWGETESESASEIITRKYHPQQRQKRGDVVQANGTHETTVWYRDLTVTPDPEDYSVPISSDGRGRKSKRGLIISSPTFTSTRPQGPLGMLDRIKWLCYYRQVVQIGGDETVYEATISGCQIFNPEIPVPRELLPRIRNVHEDYRLCCSALVLSDESSMVEAMFLITNDAIYALYQRLPSEPLNLRTAATSTSQDSVEKRPASFASSVLLMRRGMGGAGSSDLLDDYYKLGLGVSDGGTSLVWYIDKLEVFRVRRIGYRLPDNYQVLEHGGVPQQVRINSFKAGFGNFTFLDHQLPHNYSRSHVHLDSTSDPSCQVPRSESGLVMLADSTSYREVFPDVYGRHQPIIPETTFAICTDDQKYRIFGQGAMTCVRNIHIFHIHRGIPPLIPLAERELTPSPPRGRVRNENSLTSPTSTEKISHSITRMGGKMSFEESGTPVMRRSYHRSSKIATPNIHRSQESRLRPAILAEDATPFNFQQQDQDAVQIAEGEILKL